MFSVLLTTLLWVLLYKTKIGNGEVVYGPQSCSPNAINCTIICETDACKSQTLNCPTTNDCNECIINCNSTTTNSGCSAATYKGNNCKNMIVNAMSNKNTQFQNSIIITPGNGGDFTANVLSGVGASAFKLVTFRAPYDAGSMYINCQISGSTDECKQMVVNATYAQNLEIQCNEASCEQSTIYCPDNNYMTNGYWGKNSCLFNCIGTLGNQCKSAQVYASNGYPKDMTWVCNGAVSSLCSTANLYCDSGTSTWTYESATTTWSLGSTCYNTFDPTRMPSNSPSNNPSNNPTNNPTDRPSISPSYHPSTNPSYKPTSMPSTIPTFEPSNPTNSPSLYPSIIPSILPSDVPSPEPSFPTTNDNTLTTTTRATTTTTEASTTAEASASTTDSSGNGQSNSDGNSSNNFFTGDNTIYILIIVLVGLLCCIVCLCCIILLFCQSHISNSKMKEMSQKIDALTKQSMHLHNNPSNHEISYNSSQTGIIHHTHNQSIVARGLSSNSVYNNNSNIPNRLERQDSDELIYGLGDHNKPNNNNNHSNSHSRSQIRNNNNEELRDGFGPGQQTQSHVIQDTSYIHKHYNIEGVGSLGSNNGLHSNKVTVVAVAPGPAYQVYNNNNNNNNHARDSNSNIHKSPGLEDVVVNMLTSKYAVGVKKLHRGNNNNDNNNNSDLDSDNDMYDPHAYGNGRGSSMASVDRGPEGNTADQVNVDAFIERISGKFDVNVQNGNNHTNSYHNDHHYNNDNNNNKHNDNNHNQNNNNHNHNDDNNDNHYSDISVINKNNNEDEKKEEYSVSQFNGKDNEPGNNNYNNYHHNNKHNNNNNNNNKHNSYYYNHSDQKDYERVQSDEYDAAVIANENYQYNIEKNGGFDVKEKETEFGHEMSNVGAGLKSLEDDLIDEMANDIETPHGNHEAHDHDHHDHHQRDNSYNESSLNLSQIQSQNHSQNASQNVSQNHSRNHSNNNNNVHIKKGKNNNNNNNNNNMNGQNDNNNKIGNKNYNNYSNLVSPSMDLDYSLARDMEIVDEIFKETPNGHNDGPSAAAIAAASAANGIGIGNGNGAAAAAAAAAAAGIELSNNMNHNNNNSNNHNNNNNNNSGKKMPPKKSTMGEEYDDFVTLS